MRWWYAVETAMALLFVAWIYAPYPWNVAAMLGLAAVVVVMVGLILTVEGREWLARRRLKRAFWI